MAFTNQYLFIDGAYFQKVLKRFSHDYFAGATIDIDWAALGNGYQKIFYYDCFPEETPESGKGNGQQPKYDPIELLKSIRMTSNYHVYEGELRGEGKKRRQKKIDILIAVHMLTHAFRGSMTRAILLAGDLDFKPLLDALVEQGMHVGLMYDRISASKELIHAADERRKLDLFFIHSIATRQFRRDNPILRKSSGPEEGVAGLTQKCSIESSSLGAIQLYTNHTKWVVSFRNRDSDDHFIRIESENEEMLRKYLQEEYP